MGAIDVPEGISQRAIAAKAGVSVATVSRAINGSSLVSPATQSQILVAIRQLRIEGARGTVDGQARRIGLTNSHLVQSPNSGHTMLQEILGGVEAAGLNSGCSIYTVHQSGYLLNHDADNVLLNVDGLLLVGGVVSNDVIDAVSNQGIPTVLVGGHVPDGQFPSVAGDVARGTYLVVRHLAELGHRRIAFMNGPAETYTSFERRTGYISAMFDSDLPIDPNLIRWEDGVRGFSESAGERVTDGFLRMVDRPTAIIYAADTAALGGLRAIDAAGLSVPDDISIAGFDDSSISRAMSPQLTSVSVDRVEWGAMAFYRLLRLLDGEKSFAGDRLQLPVTLKVRGSTAPPKENS